MKRWLILAVFIFIPKHLFAEISGDGSLIFTNDSKIIMNVSTTAATPTQILTRDSYTTRTFIINYSTFTLFLSTVSTNFNITGSTRSFGIPGGTTAGLGAAAWSPDGVGAPFWGQMFAVLAGTSPSAGGNSVGVVRTK